VINNLLKTEEQNLKDICELSRLTTNFSYACLIINNAKKNETQVIANPELNLNCIPNQDSLCTIVVNSNDYTEIKDVNADKRLKDSILVSQYPNIKYYLGLPLFDLNGHCFGSLCVLDDKPNELNQNQLRVLKLIAKQVMNLLNMAFVENELLRSKERFKTAMEFCPDIFSFVDKNGVLVFNSSAAERIHGYKNEEIQNQNTFDYIHPDHVEHVKQELTKMIQDPNYLVNVQYQYKNKDGSYIWMEATGTNQLNNPLVEAMVTISRDIQDRKMLEIELQNINRDLDQKIKERTEQLLQVEKNAFIGRHTAEIIHNLNNPLAVLAGNLTLLDKKFPNDKNIEKAQLSLKKLNEIVKSILTVSRNNAVDSMEEIDLNDIVKSEIKLLEANPFFKHDIEITLELNPIPKVFGLPAHFSQCLGNLIKNAAESMYLTENKKLNIQSKFEVNSVVIKIIDSGHGIAKEHIDKIFDPFFTTKPKIAVGTEPTGTGLGLASVKRMLEAYNAEITIESEPNIGSCFTISFPILAKDN
jgi:PAS domain S-box-containing protein